MSTIYCLNAKSCCLEASMDKVKNPKTGDKRKGERRQPSPAGPFTGPDRRNGDRRGAASAADERRNAHGRRDDAAA
jgi:hypothetical protein